MAKVEILPSHHILICGKTGSGKSFTTKHVLIPALRRQQNQVLVILDPKSEYGQTTDVTVQTPQELNHFLYADEKPKGDIVRIVNVKPQEHVCEEFLSAAYAPHYDISDGQFHFTFGVRFFIEDMPMFYDSPYKVPEELKYWTCMGRAQRRTVVGTTQRFQLIPKTVQSQCDHVFLFRLSEYDILHSIIPVYGHRAATKIQTLERWGYVLCSDLYEEPIKFKPYQPDFVPKSDKGIYLD
jgi:hypothetical protein